MKYSILALLLSALVAGSAPAATTTVSGTLVNVAAYLTGSNTASTLNMGVMMGANGGMNGANAGMMNGANAGMMNGANAGSMYACRSALGIVTAAGELYLLVTDAPNVHLAGLCQELGQNVTIHGEVVNKGGVRALRAESVEGR